jgi:hypothetical protein
VNLSPGAARWTAAGIITCAVLALGSVQASAAPPAAKPPAPPVAPDSAGAASAVDGAVSPAQRAQMTKEAPLAKAALEIQQAGRSAPEGFAGVALRGDTVTVYWKGTVPNEVRAVLDREARHVSLAVQAAPFSAAELDIAAQRLIKAVHTTGDRRVATVSYDVTGAGLAVTSNAPARSKAALPDVGVAVKVVPAQPAAETAKAPAGKTSAMPQQPTSVAAADVGAWPDPSRQDDATPAWGGAHIINTNAAGTNHGWQTRLPSNEVADADAKYHCTSGFPVLDPSTNTELMVGSASCGAPNNSFVDPSGDSVNDPAGGFQDPAVGIAVTKPRGGAESYVYDGDAWSATGWQIADWEPPVAGQHLCVSGGETGIVCNVIVGDTVGNRTASVANWQGEGIEVSGLTEMHVDYTSGPVDYYKKPYVLKDGPSCNAFPSLRVWDLAMCHSTLGPGDVGAPVFALPSGDQHGVVIKGILTRQHSDQYPDETTAWWDMVGVEQIASRYPTLLPLTAADDQ